jgi:F-type H+-transporting ATPase subunit gamma
MSAIKELQENLESTQTARFVTTMLRDISANKLQIIRAAFEKNGAFYKEMRSLDLLVQTYAERNNPSRNKKNIQKKDKDVFVALTSNKRFFGTLNKNITFRLIERLKKDPKCDAVVIGNTGRTLLENTEFARRCSYLSFDEDTPTSAEVLSLIQGLGDYGRIYMFYPTFINSFRQEVGLIDITYHPTIAKDEKLEVGYIFEPDIEALLTFFETQVRLILFNRVLLETKLAQTGARLSKMQRAREEAGERLKEQRREIHKEMMALQSMHLLETFAGFGKKETI